MHRNSGKGKMEILFAKPFEEFACRIQAEFAVIGRVNDKDHITCHRLKIENPACIS